MENAICNVGIVGLGKMSILHAGIVNAMPNCRVIAAAERARFLVEIGKKITKQIHLYLDPMEMMEEEDLNAIFITTPIHSHVPLVMDIVRRDNEVSLFVEKPLATSYEEAKRAVDFAKSSSGQMMVGFQKRFCGTFKKAKELLEHGILGEPVFFRSHSFCPEILSAGKGWRFEQGKGGALLEFAPHLLDLLLWFFGEPRSAKSIRRSIYSSHVDDYACSIVEFESGLVGHLEVGWSMRNYSPSELMIEVHGKNGLLNVTEDRLVVNLANAVPGILGEGIHTFYSPSLTQPVEFLFTYPEYTIQNEHFLNCVLSNKEPEVGFEVASRVNKFIEMIEHS